jgi:hypothetical protein
MNTPLVGQRTRILVTRIDLAVGGLLATRAEVLACLCLLLPGCFIEKSDYLHRATGLQQGRMISRG